MTLKMVPTTDWWEKKMGRGGVIPFGRLEMDLNDSNTMNTDADNNDSSEPILDPETVEGQTQKLAMIWNDFGEKVARQFQAGTNRNRAKQGKPLIPFPKAPFGG